MYSRVPEQSDDVMLLGDRGQIRGRISICVLCCLREKKGQRMFMRSRRLKAARALTLSVLSAPCLSRNSTVTTFPRSAARWSVKDDDGDAPLSEITPPPPP